VPGLTSSRVRGILSYVLWHVALVLFSPLYLVFALLFRDDRARLVLALYQRRRSCSGSWESGPSLAKGERLALVLSSLLVAEQRFAEALLIVTPEALVGWHRAIVRRHWRFWSSKKPGRPPKTS